MLALYTGKTMVRNGQWSDIGTLTRVDVTVNPTNAILWSNLAAVEQGLGNIAACGAAFQQSSSRHC